MTLAGPLSGSAALTKAGSGTLAISGANSAFSGDTLVAGSTLRLASAQALISSAVTLADTAGVSLQLLADSTIASLAGSGTANSSVDLATFTLSTGNAADTAYAGVIGSSAGACQGAPSFAPPQDAPDPGRR